MVLKGDIMIKKKVLILLLIFVTTLLSFGCHGSKKTSNFTIPESFDTTRNYEITFWAKNDTNIVQKNIYKKAIYDFQKLYPNITITIKNYEDYGKIYEDVITNISTGTTPNICITYPDHIATYLTGNNIVVPLDDLINNKKYGLGGSELLFDSVSKDESIEKFIDECNLNGFYYAVPFMRSTEACYVNKDYVESLGYTLPDKLTWDFVWEVSEKAMLNKDPDQVLIPFMYKSTDNMMIQMIKQKGSGYSTNEGEVLIFNDTTKELLNTIASHAKNKCFSTFKISSYPGNFFNAGQCIFAIDSTAGATWIGTNAQQMDIPKEEVVEFETVVKMIPQFDVDNPQMISQGPSICIFNKSDSQEVLASWLFTQYLLTNDVQIAYSKTEGYAPVTKKAQNSLEYLDYLSRAGENNQEYYDVKIAATKLLLENVRNTFVTPVFNGSVSLRDASGEMIEEVVKATNKKQVVDDEKIQEIFSKVSSLKKLDQIEKNTDVGAEKLGELPKMSKILLISIVLIWVIIGSYAICIKLKNVKENKK